MSEGAWDRETVNRYLQKLNAAKSKINQNEVKQIKDLREFFDLWDEFLSWLRKGGPRNTNSFADPQDVLAKTELQPNRKFKRQLNLSPQLTTVVGTGPLPRTEVTKRLWAYIKARKLQDTSNRQLINADDKLAALFDGKTQVTMFEMVTFVSKHMSK